MGNETHILHDMPGCNPFDADHGETREELLEQRREAREGVRAAHKVLDGCNVPREEVVWLEGGIQDVTEFPLWKRIQMLVDAWLAERTATGGQK